MPLIKGRGSVSANVKELTTGKVGKTRRKAIRTLARKLGISYKDARMKQALAIAYSKAKEK